MKKAAVLGLTLCVGICSCTSCTEEGAEKYSDTDFAMDTVVSETLYTSGDNINPEIGCLLRNLEEQYLSWNCEDSEIYRINHSEGAPVEVSSQLCDILEQTLELAEDSQGAFEPTMGKVIRLWDIGGDDPEIPDEEELEALLDETGYENLIVNARQVTLKGGASLDLGAVGKGIGCDAVMDYLKNQEQVSGMILNLGGSSVMAYGEKNDQSPWRVAVRDPRDEDNGYLGAVTLEGGEFLSTSGDYEKYFIENGKRYHHILDPDNGYPVWNGLTAVTVICSSGLLADGLSTACFVLGVEEGTELLEKYDAEAMFVDEDHHIYLTSGMRERFELMKNTYSVETVSR